MSMHKQDTSVAKTRSGSFVTMQMLSTCEKQNQYEPNDQNTRPQCNKRRRRTKLVTADNKVTGYENFKYTFSQSGKLQIFDINQMRR